MDMFSLILNQVRVPKEAERDPDAPPPVVVRKPRVRHSQEAYELMKQQVVAYLSRYGDLGQTKKEMDKDLRLSSITTRTIIRTLQMEKPAGIITVTNGGPKGARYCIPKGVRHESSQAQEQEALAEA